MAKLGLEIMVVDSEGELDFFELAGPLGCLVLASSLFKLIPFLADILQADNWWRALIADDDNIQSEFVGNEECLFPTHRADVLSALANQDNFGALNRFVNQLFV